MPCDITLISGIPLHAIDRGGELRKYTLGDRAGTEEFNDDRIASECSQRVHLNIPQV